MAGAAAGASAEAAAGSSFEASPAAGAAPSASDEVQRVFTSLAEVRGISGVCTYQVVTEELHDEGRILVALLAEGIELYNTFG